jgi:hypothetical protein
VAGEIGYAVVSRVVKPHADLEAKPGWVRVQVIGIVEARVEVLAVGDTER